MRGYYVVGLTPAGWVTPIIRWVSKTVRWQTVCGRNTYLKNGHD